jgi:hypothetical protein
VEAEEDAEAEKEKQKQKEEEEEEKEEEEEEEEEQQQEFTHKTSAFVLLGWSSPFSHEHEFLEPKICKQNIQTTSRRTRTSTLAHTRTHTDTCTCAQTWEKYFTHSKNKISIHGKTARAYTHGQNYYTNTSNFC